MSEPAISGTPEMLRLTAPAEPQVVEQVQERLAAVWEAVPDLSPDVTMRFEMGLVEILGNIVEHAYAPDAPGRLLTVEVDASADGVQGTLFDNGQPAAIDLSTVTMPPDDAESGRGLALALAALDHLSYERDGDRNRWHLRCGAAG